MVEKDAPAMPMPAVLAFDLGGTRIKAGIIRGATVSSLLIEATNDGRDSADVLAGLLRLGRRLGDEHDVAAVGLSVKGIVDAQRGVILDVKERLAGLIGRPLAVIVARELGRPVVIENDARMYALGEWRHGAGRGRDNMVCLTLGTGVGSGVIVGGHLLRGPRGVGGILAGHVAVQIDGPVCTCGNVGCLEAQRIFEAAAAGDAPAQALAQRFATYLGAGIVTAIHAYDPDVVVLGGGVMHSFAPFLPDVQAYVDAHAWTVPRGRVRVVPAALGDAAALIGVAALTQQADQVW